MILLKKCRTNLLIGIFLIGSCIDASNNVDLYAIANNFLRFQLSDKKDFYAPVYAILNVCFFKALERKEVHNADLIFYLVTEEEKFDVIYNILDTVLDSFDIFLMKIRDATSPEQVLYDRFMKSVKTISYSVSKNDEVVTLDTFLHAWKKAKTSYTCDAAIGELIGKYQFMLQKKELLETFALQGWLLHSNMILMCRRIYLSRKFYKDVYHPSLFSNALTTLTDFAHGLMSYFGAFGSYIQAFLSNPREVLDTIDKKICAKIQLNSFGKITLPGFISQADLNTMNREITAWQNQSTENEDNFNSVIEHIEKEIEHVLQAKKALKDDLKPTPGSYHEVREDELQPGAPQESLEVREDELQPGAPQESLEVREDELQPGAPQESLAAGNPTELVDLHADRIAEEARAQERLRQEEAEVERQKNLKMAQEAYDKIADAWNSLLTEGTDLAQQVAMLQQENYGEQAQQALDNVQKYGEEKYWMRLAEAKRNAYQQKTEQLKERAAIAKKRKDVPILFQKAALQKREADLWHTNVTWQTILWRRTLSAEHLLLASKLDGLCVALLLSVFSLQQGTSTLTSKDRITWLLNCVVSGFKQFFSSSDAFIPLLMNLESNRMMDNVIKNIMNEPSIVRSLWFVKDNPAPSILFNPFNNLPRHTDFLLPMWARGALPIHPEITTAYEDWLKKNQKNPKLTSLLKKIDTFLQSGTGVTKDLYREYARLIARYIYTIIYHGAINEEKEYRLLKLVGPLTLQLTQSADQYKTVQYPSFSFVQFNGLKSQAQKILEEGFSEYELLHLTQWLAAGGKRKESPLQALEHIFKAWQKSLDSKDLKTITENAFAQRACNQLEYLENPALSQQFRTFYALYDATQDLALHHTAHKMYEK